MFFSYFALKNPYRTEEERGLMIYKNNSRQDGSRRIDVRLDKKQRYHLEPPEGLMNDPNGLVWFRDRYYVFFQWNRFKKDHSHKEWGLFTSKDLLKWEFQSGAIRPGEPYDHSGVHSGSAFVIDGCLYAFYTGSDKSGGRRKSRQCLAVSEDGEHFQKKGVLLDTPAEFTEHFRDPKVFRAGENIFFMVVGAQRQNGKGAIALCRSKDGRNWKYSHILATSDGHEMIECPDLFRLNGQDVLLYCLQRRDNEKDQVILAHSVYQMVDFDTQTGTVSGTDLEYGYGTPDAGFDFFAPQTFETPDGRRILLAWMSRMNDEQERALAEQEPRIHCLTLPRELSVEKGRLVQRPARELYRLLREEIPVTGNGEGLCSVQTDTRSYHLMLEAEHCPEGLRVELGEASLQWDGAKCTLARQNWAGADEVRTCALDGLHRVEIWADTSSLEIFLNGGEAVMSARVFPQLSAAAVTVTGMPGNASVTVRRIRAD